MGAKKTRDWKYYLKSLIGILIMILFPLLPAPDPITPAGMAVIGQMIGLIVLWTFVDMMWPTFLAIILFGLRALEIYPMIQIDDDPWEIGKNFPVECGILGDIQKSVARLNILLEPETELTEAARARAQVIGKKTGVIYEALMAKAGAEKDRSPVAVTALASAVAKVMDEDVCIVDDCWSSSAILRQIVDFKDENTLFRPRNGGSIGFGLPGGLGVKMALPKKKVLVISGDGSAAWSMQTFWTAAHYKIPVTFVITNNGTYRQVKNVRQRILGGNPAKERHLGMDIDQPVISFSDLAQSMGVKGCQVKEPSLLADTIREAMDSNEPRVVEVFIESK